MNQLTGRLCVYTVDLSTPQRQLFLFSTATTIIGLEHAFTIKSSIILFSLECPPPLFYQLIITLRYKVVASF